MKDGDSPPCVRRRLDSTPDIPLSSSKLANVQALIRQHNSVTKPKLRLRLREFLSHCFVTLGMAVVKEEEKEKQSQSFSVLLDFTKELVKEHSFLPSNTSVSKVLHAFCESGLIKEGITLIQCMLSARKRVSPEVFEKSFEERTVTVALRLCAKNSDLLLRPVMRKLEEELLSILPAEKFKRRLFSPLFERSMMEVDVQRGLEILELSVQRSVELWDRDYNLLLKTIEKSASLSKISRNEATEFVSRTLVVMEDHHPVVGAENAHIVARLLNGEETIITKLGKCEKCHEQLVSFQLTEEQREMLLNDLVQKLIRPRIEGASEKEKPSEQEIKQRWECFELFREKLSGITYDTVIDGANVGYYGLSKWYKDAKKARLIENKVDLSTVHISELEEIPFPVDVPPKFPIIESMRNCAVHQHKLNPLIVLHQRHVDHASLTQGENKTVLSKWLSEKSVLPSPPFLNDDFCWLYAALKQPQTYIISNDQMRDHHFSLLSPRFFIRWRQRHRITFKALFNRAAKDAALLLMTPRPYSIWVQRACSTQFLSMAATGSTGKNPQLINFAFSTSSNEKVSLSPKKMHWHIPFMNTIQVLEQASNRVGNSEADVDLSKDGDDECSSWICTRQ